MKIFAKIEKVAKEIFKESFVTVELVGNPEIRHIYLRLNITGEQILELQKRFRILFVSNAYDEDSQRIGKKTTQVVLVSEKTSDQKDRSIINSLRILIKDIEEIPDGDVDRYLIIEEIQKIIKETKN